MVGNLNSAGEDAAFLRFDFKTGEIFDLEKEETHCMDNSSKDEPYDKNIAGRNMLREVFSKHSELSRDDLVSKVKKVMNNTDSYSTPTPLPEEEEEIRVMPFYKPGKGVTATQSLMLLLVDYENKFWVEEDHYF